MKDLNKEAVEPFKVYIRIRPFLERELKQISAINQENPNKPIDKATLSVENNTIYLKDPFNTEFYGKTLKSFSFDNIFTEKDQNKDIFDSIIKKLIDNILQGYNSTALAYGITGTGKTHTMFGDIYQNLNLEKGICMYSVDYLFNKITSDKDKAFNAKVSYLEIYNEQVVDLLIEKRANEGMMIVEDPKKGVIVPELMQKVVSTSDEVLNYIIFGNQRRTMGPTGQNQFSSRSHAILEISIEQRVKSNDDNNREELISSKISFVDLAGSERGCFEKGIRREEGSNINKSLLALGNCINILSDKTKKGSFVPYRDSKLTRLLKDSLGGNIVTLMIACVSPSPINYEETNGTLNFAARTNKIEKKITRNVKEIDQYSSQYSNVISALRNEICQLKDIIKNQHLLLQLGTNDSYNDLKNDRDIIVNDDYFNKDDIETLEDNRVIDELCPLSNVNERNQPLLLNCNYEVYDHFLRTNLNNLTAEDIEEFGAKMESLFFDKITIEDNIKKGMKDFEINERYIIIKAFYEKFIELIRDKLIENIEQNMILKFNLREVLEINEANCINLKAKEEKLALDDISYEFKAKLEEEAMNYQRNISNNESKRNEIQASLEQNINTKSLLKKLLFKFISNTQIKEIKELQENYTSVLNEKRELEVKNKKYQEYLSTVVRDKEAKALEFTDLSNEVKKMKKQLSRKDKRIRELEKQVQAMESNQENDNRERDKFSSMPFESLKKASIKQLMKYFDDCNMKSYLNNRNRKGKRSISRSYLRRSSRSVTNNFISINLNHKIPTITAFIQGGDIFTNETQTNLINNQVIKIATKLNKNKTKTRIKNDSTFSNEDLLRLKLVKSDSFDNNIVSELNCNQSSVKDYNKNNDSNENANKSLLNLARNLRESNIPIHAIKSKIKTKQNYINNTKKSKVNKRNSIENGNNNIDTISVSAVTLNNEAIVNSSALDMMNNVLSIEGIKQDNNSQKYS